MQFVVLDDGMLDVYDIQEIANLWYRNGKKFHKDNKVWYNDGWDMVPCRVCLADRALQIREKKTMRVVESIFLPQA